MTGTHLPLAACPTCGSWPETSMRDVGARPPSTVFRCPRGHKWHVGSSGVRPLGGDHGGPLEEAVVYIAGPMAGTEDHGFPAFEAAARELRKFDLTVLSPHEDVPLRDLERAIEMGREWRNTEDYRHYLLRDLAMVAKADVLALLPGWEESGGVLAEVAFARTCGIQVTTFSVLMDLLHGTEEG